MRKISLSILTALFCGLFFQAFTQNDLVVFSNDGEKFYVYVNGVKQNSAPETNVRVTNIKQPWVKLKVVFEDNKKIPDLTTNVDFVWGAEEKQRWEFVYQIVNKSGKYKLKPYSAAEINRPNEGEQTVVNYLSETPPPTVNVSTTPNTPLQTQTITTTTIVSTNNSNNNATNPQNTGINVQLNVSPTSAGIQIHDGTTTQSNSTNTGYTTSVVSTTVISTTGNSNQSIPTTTINPTPRPISSIKCNVNDKEFESIKKSISSKSFEDSKLTLAKQISDSKCLSSSQVRDIMKLFSFEQTKLEFAKYAYKKVIDKDNYYLVNDAFQFENSIEELNEYIGK